MSKHIDYPAPSDKDLRDNPQIGGSKGATIAGATPDELEDFQGETTFEGDVGNDTNAQGGIDKPGRASRRPGRVSGKTERSAVQGKKGQQGRKTHEQQMRTLEHKADMPDARRIEDELARTGEDDRAREPHEHVRESEFAVSRGGLHQESDHNKHNRSGQAGHKPQQHRPAQEKH